MVMGIFVIIMCSQFNILASVSRLAWAFARDGGLPYSPWIGRVNTRLQIPVNAVFLTSVICLAINIIPAFSDVAFFALTSLSTLALYFSYVVPCALIVMRKIEGRMPPLGIWNLGKWGFPINCFALAWGIYCVAFLPFPPTLPVTPENFNWSGPILGAVICIALGDWWIHGKRRFVLPIDEIEA